MIKHLGQSEFFKNVFINKGEIFHTLKRFRNIVFKVRFAPFLKSQKSILRLDLSKKLDLWRFSFIDVYIVLFNDSNSSFGLFALRIFTTRPWESQRGY